MFDSLGENTDLVEFITGDVSGGGSQTKNLLNNPVNAILAKEHFAVFKKSMWETQIRPLCELVIQCVQFQRIGEEIRQIRPNHGH